MKRLPQAENWDERFSFPEYMYGTVPNDFLKSVAKKIPHGRVLCLAEGEGRNAVYLAKQGYTVTAVDFAAAGLDKIKKLAAANNVQVKTILSDLKDFHIRKNYWQGIISIFCHLAPELRKSVHQDCAAGLKSGGIFILEAYRPEQLVYKTGGPPVPELLMQLDEVSKELTGLKLEIAGNIDREINEGQLHHGKSATIQILGRKP
jgi:SAM-dependent methyltransferase